MTEKIEYLVKAVSEKMMGLGYRREKKSEPLVAELRPYAVFHADGRRPLIMESQVHGTYRAQIFRALIGDAILRFQHVDKEVDVLLVVLVRRLGLKAIQDVTEYAQSYFPKLNWVILDEFGAGQFCFHAEQGRFSMKNPLQSDERKVRKTTSGNLFSANNQWLLKILLLAGMDTQYWGGPRERPSSVGTLAKISGVPQPSVSLFVSTLERAGFLSRRQGGITVHRHAELLTDWFHSIKYNVGAEIPVRPLYGAIIDEGEFLAKVRAYCRKSGQGAEGSSLVLGNHMACHILGLGRSNVHVGKVYTFCAFDDVMVALDLVSDGSDNSGISLVRPRARQSIMRGCVQVDNLSVSDVLQCYLDVRSSQARGLEQSEFIFERILEPHFRRDA